jgi:polysaccharide export outer membrane protein
MKRMSNDRGPLGRICWVLVWLLLMAASRRSMAAEATPTTPTTPTITRNVQPGDGLIISVDEPDLLKVDKKVDSNGKITFPYLGELDVKDKNTAEIEKMIRDGLDKDWIIKPQVSVVVAMYTEQVVSVGGFVNKPGPVKLPVDRRLSLVEAISTAGDVSPRGNRKRVQLSRRGEVKEYNLNDLAKITDADKKVFVEPDDIITVLQLTF